MTTTNRMGFEPNLPALFLAVLRPGRLFLRYSGPECLPIHYRTSVSWVPAQSTKSVTISNRTNSSPVACFAIEPFRFKSCLIWYPDAASSREGSICMLLWIPDKYQLIFKEQERFLDRLALLRFHGYRFPLSSYSDQYNPILQPIQLQTLRASL